MLEAGETLSARLIAPDWARRLDVGCGEVPLGDVNVDRYRYVQAKDRTNVRTRVDLICDAHFLPFRDRSFREVYSSHVIEHVDSPSRLLREAERVAERKVTIRCPSRWMRGHRGNPFHKWTITRTWLISHGYLTEVNYDPDRRLLFPFNMLHLPVKFVRVNEIIAWKSLAEE
jgi:hypothetical protein